mmetsp:Transcript_21844/g.31274  ORF Transcript_21844/g.31274 Transcript_21844/m.31274 type:complete len:97 (+) Transcript_21844:133-423(+)
MYAKYPPTTGNGRYATASANLNFPMTTSTAPKHAVANPNNTIVVETISDTSSSSVASSPSSIDFAIVVLMALKKIRPASCTCPILNGSDEKMLKQI